MVKINVSVILFVLLFFLSGCSNNQINHSEIIYEKNVVLTGFLDYEEDYSIYFKESNSSKKYLLIECEENYAIKFKKEITLKGFFTNIDGKTYFYCGDYNFKKNNLEKEYSKLLQNISNFKKTQDKLIITVSDLNKTVNKLNSTKNHIISEISFLEDN
ncbi:MAG: hypothetical protein PF569_02590 [Candidatus Woesearchaeota archaeon]|jgi:hypothetical protein|nr:hypothetical protein [Candidatus Woesearchaeota archaeon]